MGDDWPEANVRREMLEEAIEVIRRLWRARCNHRGEHYRVRHARIYTRPQEPPPFRVGFRPKAVDLAAKIGDGYCITGPDEELISRFPQNGGEASPFTPAPRSVTGPTRPRLAHGPSALAQ